MSKLRAVLAALAIAIASTSCAGAAAAPSAASPAAQQTDGALGEQAHEAGGVTVVASWLSGSPVARVTLDTHIIDLDGFDLMKLARLRLDGGAWVAPSLWDAPEGGHHRSGMLAFDSLDARAIGSARVIELKIRDVAVPSHLLRWERAR